jgi:hypothetical protein
MRPFSRVLLGALLLSLPLSAGARQRILETDPGATAFGFCDWVHDLTSCQRSHIETQTALQVGGPVQLDGKPYVVDWMGPGYYLSDGAILEADGPPTDLKGQRWLEVYPHNGKAHVSHGWKDRDANRVLSSSDVLVLDSGRELEVRDVRLHLRVSPAPAGKAEGPPEP